MKSEDRPLTWRVTYVCTPEANRLTELRLGFYSSVGSSQLTDQTQPELLTCTSVSKEI